MTLRPAVHLVGSVPLASTEEVFRAVAASLGDLVTRIPDGETGDRSAWVGFQVPMLAAHPALVEVSQSQFSDGRSRSRFALAADAGGVAFDDLGYARAAIESYATFARLKRDGVLGDQVRFQVSLPTPLAPVVAYIAPDSQLAVEPAYTAAMARELAEIRDAVPHQDLAIQWDVAPEIALLEGVWPAPFDDVLEQVVSRLVALASLVPDDVQLGMHLCYGDAGHRHFVQPTDTSTLVALANALAPRLPRHLDWVHLPVPVDRDDDAYFAPLAELPRGPGTELYLGLVHDETAAGGFEGTMRRIATANRHVQNYGIATECGFGRRDPATVPSLLRLHHDVATASAGIIGP